MLIRYLFRARDRGVQESEKLQEQQAQIRSEERAALARELHDVVAHQLSLITLQVMAVSGSEDIDELNSGLERVGSAASRALVELRSLLGVLRRDDDVGSKVDAIEAPQSPSVVADEMRATLEEQGFVVSSYISTAAEHLEDPLKRTITRFFQETTTNMIRHAKPESTCLLECRVNLDSVILRAENQISHSSSKLGHLSTGWGIRGLKERIALSNGSLRAGPRGRLWVVLAEIPIDGSVRP